MTPVNYVTGNPYTGKNAMKLAASGYTDPRFLTFNQARQNGLMVRKGEKGIALQRVLRGVTKQDDGTEKKRSGLRGFTVFNITQTEAVQIEEAD